MYVLWLSNCPSRNVSSGYITTGIKRYVNTLFIVGKDGKHSKCPIKGTRLNIVHSYNDILCRNQKKKDNSVFGWLGFFFNGLEEFQLCNSLFVIPHIFLGFCCQICWNFYQVFFLYDHFTFSWVGVIITTH